MSLLIVQFCSEIYHSFTRHQQPASNTEIAIAEKGELKLVLIVKRIQLTLFPLIFSLYMMIREPYDFPSSSCRV